MRSFRVGGCVAFRKRKEEEKEEGEGSREGLGENGVRKQGVEWRASKMSALHRMSRI